MDILDLVESSIFEKNTDTRMLSFNSALVIAMDLLDTPNTFGIAAKVADSFYVGDVALIFIALTPIAARRSQNWNLNDSRRHELINKTAALTKVIKRNPVVKRYFDQAESMSYGEIQPVVAGYFEIKDDFDRFIYSIDHPKMISPSVDFLLAHMVEEAFLNKESEAEDYFQGVRYELFKTVNRFH